MRYSEASYQPTLELKMNAKTYIVPAFILVDAENVESADDIACEVADAVNGLQLGSGYVGLRLDEGMETIEAPEDFPGESLLQIPGIESPTVGAEILATLEALHAAYARTVIRRDGSASIEMDFRSERDMDLVRQGLRAAIATLKVSAS